mmetsp:Transcript_20124/g.40652  ORF Transcript_20124/g.40652 Transcript_20124/m.40652 type:complete len:205 (-) Transcript_20124:21-635(-)
MEEKQVPQFYQVLYERPFTIFSSVLFILAFVFSGFLMLLHVYRIIVLDKNSFSHILTSVKSLNRDLLVLTGYMWFVGVPVTILSIFFNVNGSLDQCKELTFIASPFFAVQNLLIYRVLLSKAFIVGAMSDGARRLYRVTWIVIHGGFVPIVAAVVAGLFLGSNELAIVNGSTVCIRGFAAKQIVVSLLILLHATSGILCIAVSQ